MDKAKSEVANLTAKIEKLGFNPENYSNLEKEKADLQSAVAELSERVETLTAQLSARLSFKYTDPVRGFDRAKVKGLIAKLIQVKDFRHSTSLEVTAGGKLFQVVVDEAITGKALLDRGQLKTRVTIIPLDKVQPRQVCKSACDQATVIAASHKSSAWPAIDLIGFDEEVRPAIEYVFGSSFVVDGVRAANEICDKTKTRTVTLEGDVYDPSGTISGGSANQLGTTLSKLTELATATAELKEMQRQEALVSEKLNSLHVDSSTFDTTSAQLELAKAELEAVEKQLSLTSVGLLLERQKKMTIELEAAQKECIAMAREKEEKWQLYENLKAKQVELTQAREDRLLEIEYAVKAAKIESAKKTQLADKVRRAMLGAAAKLVERYPHKRNLLA